MDVERIARNDATFRHANERIERAAEQADVELVPFLCECADERCTEIVRVSLADYEAVREHPERFLTAPDHHLAFADSVRRLDPTLRCAQSSCCRPPVTRLDTNEVTGDWAPSLPNCSVS